MNSVSDQSTVGVGEKKTKKESNGNNGTCNEKIKSNVT